MIGFIDAVTLSRAKIRSKRVMLLITVMVSSLLFGVLYGAIIISSGVSKSASEYTQSVQNGKYLIKSTPNLPSSIFGSTTNEISKDIINELNSMQANYIANQKILAKQLNITFDENSIQNILIPNPYASKNLPQDMQVMVNRSSPIYKEYLQKLQSNYVTTAKNKLSDLKLAAALYGATGYHTNESASASFTNLTFMKNGKEDLSNVGQYKDPVNSDLSTYGYLVSSVQNSMYSFMNDSLVNRFILPSNSKRESNTTSIPVIVTAKEAVDVFGKQLDIPPVPSDKDTSGQIAWMKNLQKKINGLTYTACYRNDTEIAQIAQIVQTDQDIAINKNKESYTAPSLQYNLPTSPCGGITIKHDTRTVTEKDIVQREEKTSKALGTYLSPLRRMFTFQIVGIMPVSPQENSMKSLPEFVSGLLGAQYGSGAIIPKQMYEQLPDDVSRSDILLNKKPPSYNYSALDKAGIGEVIVEFNSLESARSFLKNQGCSVGDNQCKKPFVLESFGSNYLLVDDLNNTVSMGLKIAFPIAFAIAGIIMGVTMARVIIDSRRETAIFRAIGAKRVDIVTIYLVYSINIAFRIAILGLSMGLLIAWLVQSLYSNQVTNYAKVAYGVFDKNQVFSFIDFQIAPLLLLAACIIAVSLIAISPSLIRNVRRNPIKDMRDE